MILFADDEHDLKNLFEYMKNSYVDGDNEANLYSFGRVVHKMGQFDQAEKCYCCSLNEFSSSRLYYSLGLVTMDYRYLGNYELSLEHHQQSIRIKLESLPYYHSQIAKSYKNINKLKKSSQDLSTFRYDQS